MLTDKIHINVEFNPCYSYDDKSDSPDSDVSLMTLLMHRDTVSANVYTAAKFHQDQIKKMTEKSRLHILCSYDLDLLPSHPKNYTAL